ncbi:hypothetical protein SRABI96_02690 [Peribacillus sp. Bi96]|uniref:hypothetical protein n=1 Tax=Peribacillus sp. Bi96 TaxID=2884273 RepID=UPI001DD236A0|nr:hypothetical protein [Peribacillus sp. Bi96]CAH0231548.1 hypothetical protein SRABI96_02690 [Peribacillus sp. Bi96]
MTGNLFLNDELTAETLSVILILQKASSEDGADVYTNGTGPSSWWMMHMRGCSRYHSN